MPSADVELARRFVAVWNTLDIEAMIACSDESIEVSSLSVTPSVCSASSLSA
jgi:hypothetical protein